MKKYKLYSLAAAATLTLGLSSCGEGFLTEEPASSVSIDGYYTTDARIMESAVAAYDPMHWYDYFSGWCPINLMWDIQADDMYAGGSNKDDQGYLYLISRYDSDPNNTIGGFWSANYSGINRSIRLIDNATASDLPEADKNLYIAEGRALRAWYYLCLWKTWGNIPFYMENLTFPYIAEQKSADEVYENASSKAKIHIHPTAAKADIILSGEADRAAYKKFINKILALVEEVYFKDMILPH